MENEKHFKNSIVFKLSAIIAILFISTIVCNSYIISSFQTILTNELEREIDVLQNNLEIQNCELKDSFKEKLKKDLTILTNTIKSYLLDEITKSDIEVKDRIEFTITRKFRICLVLEDIDQIYRCIEYQTGQLSAILLKYLNKDYAETAIKTLLNANNDYVGIFVEDWENKPYIGFYKTKNEKIEALELVKRISYDLNNIKKIEKEVFFDDEFIGKIIFFYTINSIDMNLKEIKKHIDEEMNFIQKHYNRKNYIIKMQFFIGVIIFFIILTVTISIIRIRIIRPLLSLEKSANSISQGNFEQPVDKYHNDEIGSLAKSFYRMRDKIKSYQEKLEDQVKERTFELSEANKNLSLSNKEMKQRTLELTLLNKMIVLLNKCWTEKDIYNVVQDICNQLFPDDSGYMLVINNSGTKLETVTIWGNASTEPQFVEFDKCLSFHLKEKQVGEIYNAKHLCPQLKTVPHCQYLCVPIIIERDKIWGVFHLKFGENKHGYSDSEHKRMIDSKHALAVRMVEQYALFLTNLRLRIIDPLTLLYNRIYIKESLENEIGQFNCIGVIMMDIDQLRHFNETHGNEAGDIVLQKLGEFLKRNIRNKDIVCRYGGGEFILIMPESTLTETGIQAKQLQKSIEVDFRIDYDGKILNITASFGVACFPEHASSVNDILNVASHALRRAKTGGRNRIVVV